jgi:uroporphyrinogen decarboxylase
MNPFVELVLNSPRRLAMPILVYPGAALAGVSIREVVSNPAAQFEASAALSRRYRSPFALSAMDLSVEAEAFGAQIVASEHEIPTVVGRGVTTLEQAQALPVPSPGAGRTGVYLETIRRLRQLPGQPMVLGGCIGPFSLAGRLAGVSETLELTLSDPALVHALLTKSTAFLTAYIQAFQAAGAAGVIMAEPGAGLLSPRGMSEFSSAYIQRIVSAVSSDRFSFILHNCAAKLVHLPALLETGSQTFHFGAPMDLPAALGKVSPQTVLCGNLDPTAWFVRATAGELAAKTRSLLEAAKAHRNFVISSGCDVPPPAPLANLDAFHQAVTS